MLPLVRIWILLSSLLVGAGWILSAFHQLNREGYTILFALCAVGAWYYSRVHGFDLAGAGARAIGKLWRRFHRPLPCLFLVLALLAFLAGALYTPANGDSNSYRTPRVFHWLGQEQWQWIHTLDSRMNIAGAGFEWLSAPLMLFTGSNRWIFLINWVSFLLLPGLIYGVFIQLGVRRAVAWWWMWLIPAGWCYALQAGSDVNDSFAVIYALASVDLALRAGRSQRVTDWWLAILAAGLLTGVKQTCLPLVLISVVAIWAGRRMLRSRPLTTLVIAALALLVSVVPITIFNLRHSGNWMGLSKTAYGWASTTVDSPLWGVIGNTFCLTAQNLKPPLFPLDQKWNAAMHHFLGTPFGAHFKSFESFGQLSRNADDSTAGLGMTLSLLVLLSWWQARRFRSTRLGNLPAPAPGALVVLLWILPWLALLVFMAKIGSYENARQLAPYYVWLFPVLLAGAGHAVLVRQRWWRRLAGLVVLSSILLLAGSRVRPLFPAQTLLGWLHERYPQSKSAAQLLASFSSQKAIDLQAHAFHEDLPPGEKVIGYYAVIWGVSETGLWQPFGSRQVERILPGDPPDYAHSFNIHYIVVEESALNLTSQTLPEWLHDHDADLVKTVNLNFRQGTADYHLYLTRLRGS